MPGKGFTLIELLVVTSIIAIISSIGLSTYRGVVVNARDSSRKQDLTQLGTALELYFQKNGRYIQGSGSCSQDTPTFYTQIASYLTGEVPKDPSTGVNYCYISVNNGQAFRLFAKLENPNDSDRLTGCISSVYDYTIVSPNLSAACPP